MTFTPLIAVHATAATLAIITGPVALWAAWVTLMIVAATSAIFIKTSGLPHIGGFGPIHVLIPVVYGALFMAFWFLAKGNITGHRMTMQRLYLGACAIAGVFTLLPGRLMGSMVWGALGLI
jgi:uncharacterized membrane protein